MKMKVRTKTPLLDAAYYEKTIQQKDKPTIPGNMYEVTQADGTRLLFTEEDFHRIYEIVN